MGSLLVNFGSGGSLWLLNGSERISKCRNLPLETPVRLSVTLSGVNCDAKYGITK